MPTQDSYGKLGEVSVKTPDGEHPVLTVSRIWQDGYDGFLLECGEFRAIVLDTQADRLGQLVSAPLNLSGHPSANPLSQIPDDVLARCTCDPDLHTVPHGPENCCDCGILHIPASMHYPDLTGRK